MKSVLKCSLMKPGNCCKYLVFHVFNSCIFSEFNHINLIMSLNKTKVINYLVSAFSSCYVPGIVVCAVNTTGIRSNLFLYRPHNLVSDQTNESSAGVECCNREVQRPREHKDGTFQPS